MRQIFLDTETTGLAADNGDRVIEIGCVELINRKLTGNNRHFYLNPGRDSHEEALKVHGITTEFLKDKPKFEAIAADLLDYLKDAELVIHNAPFDLGFLDMELSLIGKPKLRGFVTNVIDTLVMAKEMYPGKRNSLDALCDRLEVDNSGRALHGALLDAELLADVYINLTRGQDALLMDDNTGTDSAGHARVMLDLSQFDLVVLSASEQELAAHEDVLNQIDKSSGGKNRLACKTGHPMNFQQLRCVREAVRRGFNLTEVAQALHTSQPGVSRQVRELEDELGVAIFVRAGKRLTGLTPPGAALLPYVERLLQEADNIRRASDELQGREDGRLSVAATHSQARYVLPPVVKEFRQRYPRVSLHLHQGSPQQIAQMLLSGEADIGVATEALASYEQLVTLPCYRWTHNLVVLPGHPLLALTEPVTLQDLVKYPLITYEFGYTGRGHIDDAFVAAGLQCDVVMTAMDADVIKTYVELEMGVGIVASMASDPERDSHLRMLDARHLFGVNVTRLGLRKKQWLPKYAYGFIEMFVPTLTDRVIRQALEE